MTCEHPRTLTTWATLISPLVVLFVVLAFATDHWVDTSVDRDELTDIEKALSQTSQKMARIFHTRHKGLVRECYPSSSAEFLDEASNVVSSDCFYINFDDPEGISMGDEYERRMHFLRGILATYVIGMISVIIAFVLGIGLCFAKHCHVAHAATLLSFGGAMLLLTSMVLFHATEYIESNKDGEPGEIVFQNTWSKRLQKATNSDLGYSYGLAWVGIILAAFDGILFLLAGRALRLKQISDETSSMMSERDTKHVLKRASKKDKQYYDNPGAKIHGLPATPMYYGYPTFMQNLPAIPQLSYADSIYHSRSDEA